MARIDSNNMVSLKGRISEVTNSSKGEKLYSRFRMIHSRGRYLENGQWEVTNEFWISCVAFGDEERQSLIERVKRLKKGQIVHVTGRLQAEEPYTDEQGVKHGASVSLILSDVFANLDDLESFELRPRSGAGASSGA